MDISDTVYIADSDHYNKVLSQVAMVKSSLWIAGGGDSVLIR